MTDIRPVQFSLEALWAMEPNAFERMRDLVMGSSHERLAAAATRPAGITSPDTLYENSGGVAVISFKGVVTKSPSIWAQIFGGAAVTGEAMKAVSAAALDPEVKSILMVIDSPGGSVPGVADLADVVAAANVVKPVTAYAEDTMNSGAYWIGSQAGRLVGNQTAAVGSIGVFSTIPDISRMAKNMGIDVNVVKSVSGKGAGTMGAPVTEAQIAEVQRLVDTTHSLFVAAVSRGRGKNMSEVADGRVHIGQAAVDIGLLDAIEPLSTTLAAMQEQAKPKPVPVMEEMKMAEPTETIPVKTEAPNYGPQIEKLSAEVVKLNAQSAALRTEKQIDTMISGADPRKLTPGLVPTARTIAEHGGVDALKAFLSSLPTSAPDGGSVQDTENQKDAEPRNKVDYIGSSLRAYDQDNASAHQKAIAFVDKAEASGKKISYRDALIIVTRKTA